jgi:methanogenic corrinoid protein MtbC1
MITRQYELQPELQKQFGDFGRARTFQDATDTLTALGESVLFGEEELFLDFVRCTKVILNTRNVDTGFLLVHLQIMRDVLATSLPPSVAERSVRYLSTAIDCFGSMPVMVPTYLSSKVDTGTLAGEFLKALLQEERRAAAALVRGALGTGLTVKDIYLSVFQESQREVGRLWMTNQISVSQEHYCTAATQMIMAELYPQLFTPGKTSRRMVATCVNNELHEIGMRMVADLFELDGWDTSYLGANLPVRDVVKHIKNRPAEILAISCTMTRHIHSACELIGIIREQREFDDMKIIVGGYPFIVVPTLWKSIGADGYACDAGSATALAEQLLC